MLHCEREREGDDLVEDKDARCTMFPVGEGDTLGELNLEAINVAPT